MDPERWRRVEALFHRARDLSAEQRAAFLEAECGGDGGELRAEVERMLSADERPSGLVDRLASGALRPAEDPLIGSEIGAYRLTSRLGAGGMGRVYRAERTDGLFRHEVAIKLIRAELASEDVVRRFELERRTLAGLRHPNIAQLHGGGTAPNGSPYLVMELVRGVPIDRWCDERRLSIDQRLRLFVVVCRAVQFAHRNLVVHRDLKPANILVDETGAPKLLDFGIARLLDEGVPDELANRTRTGAYLLTPDYASPEQIVQGPVTTAMDVYSLGVVLCELLTGRRPFTSGSRSPLEWQRDVLECPPTRPSSMVAPELRPAASGPSTRPTSEELAARRGASPRALQRRLRGDVDRIVLMALRKEPERRYASAKDMADDIERHFDGQPVQARGDSFAYRAATFVRRNRIAVGSATAIALALVVGFVLALAGRQAARQQAEHARIEAQSFQEIATYLMDTFLTYAPGLDREQLEQKRRRIALHAARLRREHAGDDHLRANLLDSLGRVAQRLGLADDAAGLVQEALEIRRAAFGEDSLEYALSLRSLGTLAYERGEPATAADALGRALALHRSHAGETHTDVASVANDLAACLRSIGRVDEAEALHREALELRRAQDPGSVAVAESLNNLAGVELDRGDPAAAARLLEESLAIRRGLLGDEDPLTLQSMSNLATACSRLDRSAEADALLEQVEQGSRALGADGEEVLARALSNRAALWIAEGQAARAAPLLDEALALQTRRQGPLHPAAATTLERLADVQADLGETDEARESWERVVAIRRRPGTSTRALAQSLYEYGVFLSEVGDREEARAVFEEAVELLRSGGPGPPAPLARAELGLARALLDGGQVEEARPHLEQVLALASQVPGGMEEVAAKAREALQQPSDRAADPQE
jgi:serine/threonine-protein kinase